MFLNRLSQALSLDCCLCSEMGGDYRRLAAALLPEAFSRVRPARARANAAGPEDPWEAGWTGREREGACPDGRGGGSAAPEENAFSGASLAGVKATGHRGGRAPGGTAGERETANGSGCCCCNRLPCGPSGPTFPM